MALSGQSPVPLSIRQQIAQENQQFLLLKGVFSQDFYFFVWELLHLYTNNAYATRDFDPHVASIQFAVRFFVDVLCHSKDKPMFTVWVRHILTLLRSNQRAGEWLLRRYIEYRVTLSEVLLECPIAATRTGMAELVSGVIALLTPPERPLLVGEAERFVACERELQRLDREERRLMPLLDAVGKSKSLVIAFLESLFGFVRMARRQGRMAAQFWQVFESFARQGPDERRYLMARGMVATVVHYCCGTGDYAPPPLALGGVYDRTGLGPLASVTGSAAATGNSAGPSSSPAADFSYRSSAVSRDAPTYYTGAYTGGGSGPSV